MKIVFWCGWAFLWGFKKKSIIRGRPRVPALKLNVRVCRGLSYNSWMTAAGLFLWWDWILLFSGFCCWPTLLCWIQDGLQWKIYNMNSGLWWLIHQDKKYVKVHVSEAVIEKTSALSLHLLLPHWNISHLDGIVF